MQSLADTLAKEEVDTLIDTQVKPKAEALFYDLDKTLADQRAETLSDTLA